MTSSDSHDGMASSLVVELHPNEEPEKSINIEFSKRSQNPGISIDAVAVTSDATITGRATSAEQQAMTESIRITEDSGVEALRCRNEITQRSSEPIEKEQKNFELGQRGASDSQDLIGEGSALTINRELGLVEGYELEVLHEPRPPNIPKADVVIVNGSGQAWEVPWTFQEKTPHPTHQAPEMPKRGVLDNSKMLPRDIGSWGRIMNFHWPWNFLADISDDEVDNFLAKTADRLLTQLRKIRKDKSASSDFLVLIGTGFGCCIIHKLIVNLHSVGPLKQTVLDEIASIVLVDSPDPRGPPNLLETFSDFYHTILERELFTASLYQELSPDEDLLDFITDLSDSAVHSRPKRDLRSDGRFPMDQSYEYLVNRIRCGLVLICVSDWISGIEVTPEAERPGKKITSKRKKKRRQLRKDRSIVDGFLAKLIEECTESGFQLESATDPFGLTALHRAVMSGNEPAVQRLVSAFPNMVDVADKDGRIPLHIAVMKASRTGQQKSTWEAIIQKLVSTLTPRQTAGANPKDHRGFTPWDYAERAMGQHRMWLKKLKIHDLRTGATAAQHERLEALVAPPQDSDQYVACRKAEATLVQFYIQDSTGDKTEKFEMQHPDVYKVLYNPQHQAHIIFDRNRIRSLTSTCRWIHLPATNEKWAQDLFTSLKIIDRSMQDRHHQGAQIYDRFMMSGSHGYTQALEGNPNQGSPHRERRAIALFIPILGFGTHSSQKKLAALMKGEYPSMNQQETRFRREKSRTFTRMRQEPTETFIEPPGESLMTLLLRGYLRPRRNDTSLHCRRTLDQFTYRTLESTQERDDNQVMLKWSRKHRQDINSSKYPLLMVDQLWLWILDDKDNTVVTCCLDSDSDHPTTNDSLLYHMRARLKSKNSRPLIQSGLELAHLIIKCSVTFLRRQGPLHASLQETFETSINEVSNELSQQFKSFQELVKRLDAKKITQREKLKLTDKLFELTKETALVSNIMDIQNELKTIRSVFLAQQEAIRQFRELAPMFSSCSTSAETNQPKKKKAMRKPLGENQVKDNVKLIKSNIEAVDELARDAENIHRELNNLLDLKQKLANVWEARFARIGTEQARRQGNITLVFTLVTLFFLPLSFMASVLAIQLDIYPHSAETGEVLWPARQAFGYLIGISFAVIFPLIFIAFRVNPIAGFFSTYIWAQPREPDEEPTYVPLSPKLKDFHTHIPGLRRLWEWRRYLSAQSGTSSSNTGMVSSDLQGEKWSSAVETDYPLHRWGLGLRRVFRRKAMEDLDGGNGKQGSEHGGKYDGDDLGQVGNYKQTMAYGAMKETVKEVRGGDDEVQEESKGKLRGAVDGVTERMKASVSRRRVVARVDLEKGDLRQDH